MRALCVKYKNFRFWHPLSGSMTIPLNNPTWIHEDRNHQKSNEENKIPTTLHLTVGGSPQTANVLSHISWIHTWFHSEDAGWWNTRWCLFSQTGEAAHQNSVVVTASLKESRLKRSSIYRQRKTSCFPPSLRRNMRHSHYIFHSWRKFYIKCRPLHRIRQFGGCVAKT